MATVQDVAAYILEKQGSMTAMKLQKLAFYANAWGLAWENDPLFEDSFEAWERGPVSRALFRLHRKMFTVSRSNIVGDSQNVTSHQRRVVDAVLAYYGNMSPDALSDLTHREDPWRQTYEGRGHVNTNCDDDIDRDLIRRFYSAQSAQGAGPKAPQAYYQEPNLDELDAIVDANDERWHGALALLAR